MDKRQLCSVTVMPSWCCAVLAGVDHAVMVPRGQLRDHLLETPQWYLLLIPLSVTAFSRMQKSWGQRWFSLPWPGSGQGSCGRKGLPPKVTAGGNGSADTNEKLYPGLNTSCQNLTEGVQREQSLASYFSPIIGNVALLSPQGLRRSSATRVYFLFVLFLCPCVSKHVPFLPLSSVLRRTPCTESSPPFGVRGLPITATYYL